MTEVELAEALAAILIKHSTPDGMGKINQALINGEINLAKAARDFTNFHAFMADLRADREELVVLRKMYDGVLKAMNKDHKTSLKKLEAVCDALPERRAYLELRHAERLVQLGKPVKGYEQ